MPKEPGHSSAMRELAAIMFTDIAGYTAMMGKDANRALKILHINREIQRPLIGEFRGKWKTCAIYSSIIAACTITRNFANSCP
jgi:hypothetical protein